MARADALDCGHVVGQTKDWLIANLEILPATDRPSGHEEPLKAAEPDKLAGREAPLLPTEYLMPDGSVMLPDSLHDVAPAEAVHRLVIPAG